MDGKRLCLVMVIVAATTKAFITRLPCAMHADFHMEVDTAAPGNVVATVTAHDTEECSMVCIWNYDCIYAHFNADDNSCALIDHLFDPAAKTSTPGTTLLYTVVSDGRRVGQICEESKQCSSLGRFCSDVCWNGIHDRFCFEAINAAKKEGTASIFPPDNTKPASNVLNSKVDDTLEGNADTAYLQIDFNLQFFATNAQIRSISSAQSEYPDSAIIVYNERDQYNLGKLDGSLEFTVNVNRPLNRLRVYRWFGLSIFKIDIRLPNHNYYV